MTEVFAKDCTKFDILIETKTLCRKSKTTTWAELVENGFKIADMEWDEGDKVVKTSGEGHVRLGLLSTYLTDVNRFLDPAVAKVILPEISGTANGLCKIVLVGYVEGSDTPNPLITTMFEFSQKPGERIKVSTGMQACFQREDELDAIENHFFLLVRSIHAGLDYFKADFGGVPYVVFEDDPTVPEHLRGRKFSPVTTRKLRESDHQRSVVINIREHTTEPEGVSPPYLCDVSAETTSEEGVALITYEGKAEVTAEQKQLVEEVIYALQKIIYSNTSPRVAPHGVAPY